MQCDKIRSICILLYECIQFDQHQLLKMLFYFSSVYFLLLFQNSGVYRCIDSCLDFQFNFIDHCFHFHGNIMLFLLL